MMTMITRLRTGEIAVFLVPAIQLRINTYSRTNVYLQRFYMKQPGCPTKDDQVILAHPTSQNEHTMLL